MIFSLSPERCAICASWLPKANFVKICTRGSISGPSPCRVYANARKILNRTWIMKWSATPHSLATACVLTPKRGVPGWPLRPLPRQHGAVTFANFLPASRGWPPLPLADASLWTWLKMRSTVCAITGRRAAPPRLRRCWAQRQKTSISSTVCNWNTLSLSAARQSRFLLPDVNCLTFRARVKPASMTRIGYANTWRVLV